MSSQVVTSNEGEKNQNQFNFESWIVKWKLVEIKDLFIKHNATTRNALKTSSSQFQSMIIDPVLLMKPQYIPKILLALQDISLSIYMIDNI